MVLSVQLKCTTAEGMDTRKQQMFLAIVTGCNQGFDGVFLVVFKMGVVKFADGLKHLGPLFTGLANVVIVRND